ncbi:unnamed protein product [Brassica oleracea var. botrytis]
MEEMKGKFCLIASLLVLSLVFSSYTVSAHSYQSHKLKETGKEIHIHKVSKIIAIPSKSPPGKGPREKPKMKV